MDIIPPSEGGAAGSIPAGSTRIEDSWQESNQGWVGGEARVPSVEESFKTEGFESAGFSRAASVPAGSTLRLALLAQCKH